MSTPVKFGTEFLVNTTTSNGQFAPSITALADGRFVLTWMDNSATGGDTSSDAVRAQVFNADGSKSGAEFLVNTTTTNPQQFPKVTALADGRFVVTWTDFSATGGDTSSTAIRAQVFNANGSKSGTEFLVNTTTASYQDRPSITTLADGRFVVTWADGSVSGGDTSVTAVRAQVFNADGSKSGTEFLVNTTTSNGQDRPSITALTDGRFVVTWEDSSFSGGDTNGFAVRAQVFNADGSKSGAEFLLNTTTTNSQFAPSITALAGGRFVVTWQDFSQTGGDTSSDAVRAQVFNADGSKSGAEFLVNTTTANGQFSPSITALADGRFVVTWTDSSVTGEDTIGNAVRAQVFNADGSKSGSEFLVNTTTNSNQGAASVTALADGRFVVTWEDQSATGGDTSSSAIRGQVFDPRLSAVSLSGTDLADQWVGTGFDDVMQGLLGKDVLDGAAGIDTAEYSEKSAAVVVTLNGATLASVTVGGVLEDSLKNIENLTGGLGNDQLTGDGLANLFMGGGGSDVLATLGGDDTAYGDAGNDYLYMGEGSDFAVGGAGIDVLLLEGGNDTGLGGADQDYLFGGAGNDQLNGEGGVDVLNGEAGDDVIFGGADGDFIYAGADNDTAYGGDGNDIFVVDTGDDSAFGEAGQDYFYMGDGNDSAVGGAGVDVFLGGAGNDVFEGGTDVDYAWGEAGNDIFVLRAANGVLVVQDFTAGGAEDQVRLAADTGITSLSQALAAATYVEGINTTILTIDGDTAVWLVGVNSAQLTAADFAFV
jgi:RTX calcium-binding nonapeptide repeat (4 copies)